MDKTTAQSMKQDTTTVDRNQFIEVNSSNLEQLVDQSTVDDVDLKAKLNPTQLTMDDSDMETLQMMKNDQLQRVNFILQKIDLNAVEKSNMFYESRHFTISHCFNPKILVKIQDGVVTPNTDLVPQKYQIKQWMVLPCDAFEKWLQLTKKVDNDDSSVYLKIFISCLTPTKAVPLCVLFHDFKSLRFRNEPHIIGDRSAQENTTPVETLRHYTFDHSRHFLVVNVTIQDQTISMKTNNKKFNIKLIKFNRLEDVLKLPIHFMNKGQKLIRTVDKSHGRILSGGQFISIFTTNTSKCYHYSISSKPNDSPSFTKELLQTAPNSGYYTAAIIDFVRVYFLNGIAHIDCSVHHLFEVK